MTECLQKKLSSDSARTFFPCEFFNIAPEKTTNKKLQRELFGTETIPLEDVKEAVRDIAKEIQDRINEGKEVLLITKKHRESEEMYKETQARLEELYWAKELLVGSSKEDST